MSDPIIDLSDHLEDEICAAFLDAVEKVRANVDLPSLVAVAERNDQDSVLAYVGDRLRPLQAILEHAFAKAGAIAADRLGLSFDPADPVAFAARIAAIASIMRPLIGDTTQAMLQAAFRSTLLPPRGRAIAVQEAIGLSPAQSTSLAVFRSALEDALARQQPEIPRLGFTRQQSAPAEPPAHHLRHLSAPQRSAIEKATRLKLDRLQIETLVARQRRALLDIRAGAIGTAGAIMITNAGEAASWQQAVDRRDLGVEWRRFWRDMGDERVRHAHREVKDLNPDGVAIDKPFDTALGSCMHPPLEAGCRCRVELRRVAA